MGSWPVLCVTIARPRAEQSSHTCWAGTLWVQGEGGRGPASLAGIQLPGTSPWIWPD